MPGRRPNPRKKSQPQYIPTHGHGKSVDVLKAIAEFNNKYSFTQEDIIAGRLPQRKYPLIRKEIDGETKYQFEIEDWGREENFEDAHIEIPLVITYNKKE